MARARLSQIQRCVILLTQSSNHGILKKSQASMSFDFVSYLSTVDPTQSYDVRLLTGGVVNLTARASRMTHCDASKSRFPSYPSFIVKHAPPFVAGVGPRAPFSTFRQVRSKWWFLNAHLLIQAGDYRGAGPVTLPPFCEQLVTPLQRGWGSRPDIARPRSAKPCVDHIRSWSSPGPV